MTRALLVDRDGTLIVDVGYPRDPARVAPLPGALAALHALQARFSLVIISNQSGIGRGLIQPAEARAVHDEVIAQFAAAGVTFAGAYYCPHAPDAGCPCRKPAPGLIHDAARDLGLDLAASVMLGDKPSDTAAGRAAGCRALRFGRDGPSADPSADPSAPHCPDWPAVLAALAALA